MLFNSFRMFQEGDNGGGNDGNGTPSPAPAPAPAQTPATSPAPAPAPASDNGEIDALKKQMEAMQGQLKTYQDKEEQERQNNLSAEQKAKELEAKLKASERNNLIEKVRRSHGFIDKVYDVVSPTGDTEDEIKGAFDSHKTALDAFLKDNGKQPGRGTGTETTTTPNGNANGKDNRSYLEKTGFVKSNQAV